MATTASISGLSSGVQWADLIDQVIDAEKAQSLTPVTSQITAADKRRTAWQSFATLATTLGDAAKALQAAGAFGTVNATAPTSPSTSRALLSATAAAGTAPGTYQVEVLGLARAEKLSGGVMATATDALGIAGDFLVNGRRVEIAATDSLNAVRDKINAVNSGTGASGVAATVLSTGSGSHRLVLTSATAGAAGIELTDGTGGALAALGVVDGAKVLNRTADGGTQSHRVAPATAAIAAALGVTLPSPSTVKIGGVSVTVDLSVDSLSSIAAKIHAAGGSAEMVSDAAGGARLVVGGAVSADTPDGQRSLELLGFVTGGRSAIAQTVQTGAALTSGGAAATAATSLTSLGGGVAEGDSFTVRGTRGDGTAVSFTYTVGSGDTVQSLLDRLNGATDGFGAGARPAVASLENGRIVLTDGTGGESQLSLSLTANNEGGGALDFGRATVSTAGRLREVTAGSDARLRVDGVLLSRPSNTVSDALAGVTLNLQAAEPGTTIDLSIARDDSKAVDAVKAFATAYNAVAKFLDDQRTTGQPLYGNSILRSSVASLTNALRTQTAGGATYNRAAIAGVSLTRTGTLEVNEATLTSALTSNLDEVQALFGGAVGKAVADAATAITRSSTGTTATQLSSIESSKASLQKRADTIQARLDAHKERLTAQYAQMEVLLSKLQSQGNWLSSQTSAMNKS